MGWGEPNGQRDPLLTGVKLKVEKGQRVLVLGPNGAGKTTLLKVISGQYLHATLIDCFPPLLLLLVAEHI